MRTTYCAWLPMVAAVITASPVDPALAKASIDEVCVLPGHKVKRYYSACEKDGGERASFEEDAKPLDVSASKKRQKESAKVVVVPPPPPAPAPAFAALPLLANPLESKACHDGWNAHLSIGDSFNDLNFLDTTSCNGALAKGAQFSWARDRVAFNDQWAAKGAMAEKLIWINPDPLPTGPYMNLFAVAPTVTFQRVTNSNSALAAQNANVLTYGFSSEALFARIPDLGSGIWQVYTRARANVISDFSGLTKSYSATAEIEPLSDTYRIGSNIPVGQIGYFWFYPLVRAQYFERASKLVKDPIFDTRDQVLRAGPVISLNFVPQDDRDVDPNKPPPTPKWLFNVTYSWYRDFYSGRTFDHFNPSVTYNFTDNIGLTLAYESGKIEQTGKKVDLTTISLSVKN
ncbi:hypothetical protein ACVOMS_11080 [Bradyrhizobium guangxiense]